MRNEDFDRKKNRHQNYSMHSPTMGVDLLTGNTDKVPRRPWFRS